MASLVKQKARELGRQLCRSSFAYRHGLPTLSEKRFWRRGGWTIAYLPHGYKLAVSRDGVFYLIRCHVAMPVAARNKQVIAVIWKAYARWL